MDDSSDLEDKLDFYYKLGNPLALTLPDAEEKSRAAAWLLYLGNDASGSSDLRADYLQLLLFALQRRRLVGIFAAPPDTSQPLQPFPEGASLVKMMRKLGKEATGERGSGDRPAVTSMLSHDLKQFLAIQPLPHDRGAHCYMAISPDAYPKWKPKEKARKRRRSAPSKLSCLCSPPSSLLARSSPIIAGPCECGPSGPPLSPVADMICTPVLAGCVSPPATPAAVICTPAPGPQYLEDLEDSEDDDESEDLLHSWTSPKSLAGAAQSAALRAIHDAYHDASGSLSPSDEWESYHSGNVCPALDCVCPALWPPRFTTAAPSAPRRRVTWSPPLADPLICGCPTPGRRRATLPSRHDRAKASPARRRSWGRLNRSLSPRRPMRRSYSAESVCIPCPSSQPRSSSRRKTLSPVVCPAARSRSRSRSRTRSPVVVCPAARGRSRSRSRSRTRSPVVVCPAARGRSRSRSRSRTRSPVVVCPAARGRSRSRSRSRTRSPVVVCPAARSRSPSPSRSRTRSPVVVCPAASSRSPTHSYRKSKSPVVVCPAASSRSPSPSHRKTKSPFVACPAASSRSPSPSSRRKKSPILLCSEALSPSFEFAADDPFFDFDSSFWNPKLPSPTKVAELSPFSLSPCPSYTERLRSSSNKGFYSLTGDITPEEVVVCPAVSPTPSYVMECPAAAERRSSLGVCPACPLTRHSPSRKTKVYRRRPKESYHRSFSRSYPCPAWGYPDSDSDDDLDCRCGPAAAKPAAFLGRNARQRHSFPPCGPCPCDDPSDERLHTHRRRSRPHIIYKPPASSPEAPGHPRDGTPAVPDKLSKAMSGSRRPCAQSWRRDSRGDSVDLNERINTSQFSSSHELMPGLRAANLPPPK